MQLFSADATVILFYFIFAPQNMKKPTSKVAHNRPNTYFFQYWPNQETVLGNWGLLEALTDTKLILIH